MLERDRLTGLSPGSGSDDTCFNSALRGSEPCGDTDLMGSVGTLSSLICRLPISDTLGFLGSDNYTLLSIPVDSPVYSISRSDDR